ncbi:MAG: DUF1573 domain-containing protein [Gemmatimonadota bacterium]|nr:MAG: DUF1573 domain-containing protein [Gemmatimonadota bacterium]
MKGTVGRIVALVVVVIIGVAAIYFVASNAGNKVVPPVAEGEKVSSGETAEGTVVATGPQPQIQFEEMVYDWGTVYQNQKVPHVFKFKNVGEVDLVIENVRSS